jgi:hypothetical protein
LELKLNGTHQLLAYADDVNLLGYNIDTTKKNTETSIDATKEVSLEVNQEKTQYIALASYENARNNPSDGWLCKTKQNFKRQIFSFAHRNECEQQ